ncbi:TetR/AcrR family transcriptional regulator [Neptunomonas concharum]|uniref:TetR/AcrR family transcriptional regulator n=1 Tax=Neptunomonas concharum TaxID=1031538 RepID=A0A5P1R9R4_9GAMM|nr:TetR/AcrR family transcriptional regulator [Neptunomonas concharum]QEQ96384.1 TetR/AcrR family transcriptional regulator [Neptunomonas concharum]
MPQSKTALRIQQAAETLFAEQGFAETTMRQITTEADVNLAAVNYHFGSKQGLIQAVSETYLGPFAEYLQDAVHARTADTSNETVAIEELIEMLVRAMLYVHQDNTRALPMFTRLLELAYLGSQEDLRSFLARRFKTKLEGFIDLLRKDTAPMPDEEFFWRLHFMMGAMIFTLSNYHTLRGIEKETYNQEAAIEKTLHRMIPVLAAGFQARAENTQFCRL